MANEIGNQMLSANFLEKIEDDLEANQGPLFSRLDESARDAAMEKLRLAVPSLVNAYRNRMLSGRDTQRTLDPNFLEQFSEVSKSKDADLNHSESQAQAFAQKIRDSLPVLINAYRLEFGLPLRMR